MNNKSAKLIAAGGIPDHIHLYASLPSTISVADFVNAVKSNSSRWIHESYPRLRHFAWQEGYGAFSVSKSEESRIVRYISNQENHHRKRTFKEELLALLKKHGIPYDSRYIWIDSRIFAPSALSFLLRTYPRPYGRSYCISALWASSSGRK